MKPIISKFKDPSTFPPSVEALSISDLKKFQNQDWYVWFRFYDEESRKWKLVIKKGGSNYKDLSIAERKAQLIALKKAITYKLKFQKWNPLNNTYEVTEVLQEWEMIKEMTFNDALDFVLKKKKIDCSPKTYQDYKSAIKYLKEAANDLCIDYLKVVDVRKAHCRFLLDKVAEKNKLSPAGYNKYRDYLSSFFGCLEEYLDLEYNPVSKIKYKQTIKVVANRPPTREELRIIIPHIHSNFYSYYRFLSVLFGTTIRPKEICGLKIKHLLKPEQAFRIIPVRDEQNSKILTERDVVIPDWVMEILSELNLHKYDPEWYIFSTRNRYSTFLPGPTRMHSNTPTRWWRDIVKSKDGLNMNVNQYGLKKLAGNEMIKLQRREGVHNLLELPRQQMGHATTKMTEVYVDEHKAIINEVIRRKMPKLLPVDN